MKRKLICVFLAGALAFVPIENTKNILNIGITSVQANTSLLYKDDTIETITSGVTYTNSNRLYMSGWKDIHVLQIDMTNPNVDIEILDSTTTHGLKKNVLDLVNENGAIAGINADFFGSGNPSSSMGQIIENNNVFETQSYYNWSESVYGGIFVDNNGISFIDYLKSIIGVYNDEGSVLELQGKNKVTDFSRPLYFDTLAMKDTSQLDSANSNLFKVVVENNTIIHKAGAGEVVSIPENGYVIVMNKDTASSNLHKFVVGEKLYFSESYSFWLNSDKNISEIETGISAGGEILRNGTQISNGLSISPSARNPRSAIGVSQDGTKIIMVAVDGRGTSMGATHSEMAEILLEFGAYNAIHLDGGGSTTMAIRPEGEENVKIINNYSDSSPRVVPNAIGVKSTNPTGELSSLLLEIESDYIISGVTYNLKISGKDEFENPVAVDNSKFNIGFSNGSGTISGTTFTPNQKGIHTLNVTYENGISEKISFTALDGFSYIEPSATNPNLLTGETTTLHLHAMNKDGYSRAIDTSSVVWYNNNPEIGSLNGNTFTATSDGMATITAYYNDLIATITISVGNKATLITSFEVDEVNNTYMSYYPNNNTVGGSSGVSINQNISPTGSLFLNYSFPANYSSPQATYVGFNEPIAIQGTPNLLQINVKGDGSNNSLKAIIRDVNNVEYPIIFTSNLNSIEWQTATAEIPSNVAYPIKLDKIYVAASSTTDARMGTIYVDDLMFLEKKGDGGVVTGGFVDYMSKPLSSTSKSSTDEDINVFGQTANKPFANSSQILANAISTMSNDARALVFAGDTDFNNTLATIPVVRWNNTYHTNNTSNLSIINLATKSGNMIQENSMQWAWLQSYLKDFSKNNILICMDKNIWDSNNDLTDDKQNELLHTLLSEFVRDTNKNIIVASSLGNSTSSSVKDGVRYITLNGLSGTSETDLSSYKYLKIRANEHSMSYEITNLY